MSHDEALARIAELEDALARKTFEAEMHKEGAKAAIRMIPFEMPTEAEMDRLVRETDGQPIREIIAELKRELA